MPLLNRRADLLERGIQGLRSPDQQVHALVATASRIPALTSAACAPRDEFIAALGLRLRAEALTLPAREPRPRPSVDVAPRPPGRPRIFVIGTGLPRVLAGATAALLLIGALVGVSSRSALPDGLLYPVKQALDSVAVQLAGSELDRGTVLLSQSQEHISDARSLVERDGQRADPSSVSQALSSAYDALSTGQRSLLGDFDRTRNTSTLIAVQDFASRALPQLNALSALVPPASRPEVDALIALLHESQATVARRIEVCGQSCASLGGISPGSSPSSVPSLGATSTPTAGGRLSAAGPTAAVTRPRAVLPSGVPKTVRRGSGSVTVPQVTIGSLTIRPSPIAIPPVASVPPVLPVPPLPPGPLLTQTPLAPPRTTAVPRLP